jgi:hypothetical protein
MYDLRLSQRWLWRMSSSAMWRCVDLELTDVSEERIARSVALSSFTTPDRYPAAYTHPAATCCWPSPLTPLSSLLIPLWHTLLLSLFLYSWLSLTGGSVCSHLLTLVHRSRIYLPWRWRRYVPPKRRITQDLHSATSQKTTSFLSSCDVTFGVSKNPSIVYLLRKTYTQSHLFAT